jgi:hypothetical protein
MGPVGSLVSEEGQGRGKRNLLQGRLFSRADIIGYRRGDGMVEYDLDSLS